MSLGTEWMVGVVKEFGPKATVQVKAAAVDEARGVAVFYAVFAGFSDYVYALSFDHGTCKIDGMSKVWNDAYAAKHAPPACHGAVVAVVARVRTRVACARVNTR